MKDDKIMSVPAELVDAVLFMVTTGFFVFLSYVTIDGLLVGDRSGAFAAALFATMNGFISVSAFRLIRASLRARAIKEAQEKGLREWQGDRIR